MGSGGVDRKAKMLRPQTFTGEPYSGWRNWDTWEFALLIDNDEPAYRREMAFKENFDRKIKRGNFDREKAKYILRQYMGQEVRRLEKEYDPDNGRPDQRVNFDNVDFDEILNHVLEK